eukprot:TRINITY_DN184_c0_g1_i1.p1 TRINITY_DN184_c0_g1~~TRINITY_DN184_c0_g1_i1.p1  ORF type:complete len:175 (-),score=19.16 TRINITY_DN184_c0_g1_i1:70-594(-)
MKVLIVLSLLVVAALCITPKENGAPPSENMLLFIEGFAIGLEVEIGNPAVCAKDLNVTETDILDGYQKIKSGVDNWDIYTVEDGLRLWSMALNEVSYALGDCGAEKLAADIQALTKELSSGTTGLLEFVARELLAIIENDVQVLFDDAFVAMEAGDWKTLGIDSGKIIGILLNQ